MCRKRNIDDKVVEAADGQVEAVVNLGAGFDTMAMSGPIKGWSRRTRTGSLAWISRTWLTSSVGAVGACWSTLATRSLPKGT